MFGMTPKVPDWLEMGMSANVDPSLMQTGSVKPNKGGMFGGGIGQALGSIAGTMGDYFLQRSGMQPMYGPQMAQQRMLKMQEEQYQRQRQDSMADWQAKQQWQLDHPSPVNNDTVADYTFISNQLGPDAGKRFLETKTNPIVMTPYGPMPYSAVAGGAQVSAPVGKLTPIDGGPTPSASGGFPPFGY